MNDDRADGGAGLAVTHLRWIDAACDRFEAAWRDRARPSLDTFLAEAPAALQPRLLRELLLVDLEYRRDRGDRPAPEDYQAWLSAFGPVVHEVLELAPGETPARPGPAPPPTAPPPAPAPTFAGHVLEGPIGRGGMGVVHRAYQPRLKRWVAVKVLGRGECAVAEERARFRQEAEHQARLRHPNIVQVFDAGDQDGQPYIVMELLDGGSLADRLKAGPVAPGRAARWLREIAAAVHCAHEAGVIHRDLKPGNVLFTAGGVPKVADFGLAKGVVPAGEGAGLTQSLVILGTPEYLAPELARGQARAAGPAVDVYGLGAILYELLTGRPPFRGKTVAETLDLVATADPVPPRRGRRGIPADLERICLKCLEKAPGHRFASAWALAEDLDRFLNGEPVLARPTPAWQRGVRRLWKRRAGVGLAAALLAAAACLAWGFWAIREADEAQRCDKAWTYRQKGLDACQRGDVGVGLLWLARAREACPEAAAALRHLLGLDLGAWESQAPALTALLPHPAKVRDVQFSPQGDAVLTVDDRPAALIWDAERGACRAVFPHPAAILKAAFAEEGRQVRTVAADGVIRTWDVGARVLRHQGEARCVHGVPPSERRGWVGELLWEFETGAPPPRRLEQSGSIWLLRASPDRRRVLTATYAGDARLWDGESGEPLGPAFRHQGAVIYDAWFGPDGRTPVTAEGDGWVRFWDSNGRGERPGGLEHGSPVRALALAPRGQVLAAGDTAAVNLWDLAARRLVVRLPHHGLVRILAFSPDGRRLASGRGDHELLLWRMPPDRAPAWKHPWADLPQAPPEPAGLRRASRGIGGILQVAYHPDGQSFLSTGVDTGVRRWDLAAGKPIGVLARHDDAVGCAAWSADGRRLLTGGWDRQARLWDGANGRPLGPPLPHPAAVGGVAFCPTGGLVATGCMDQEPVRVWDPLTGQCQAELGPAKGTYALAFNSAGRALAAGRKGGATLWEYPTGRGRSLSHGASVFAVAFHPHGDLLLTGDADGRVAWWDVPTGECRGMVPAHTDRVTSVAFGPDGAVAVTVGWDRKAIFWDVRTRRQVGPAYLAEMALRAAAFHPAGAAVALGGDHGLIRFAQPPQVRTGPGPVLTLWAETVSGLAIDSAGEVYPLSAEAWTGKRQALANTPTQVP